jgi:hypothetical protein
VACADGCTLERLAEDEACGFGEDCKWGSFMNLQGLTEMWFWVMREDQGTQLFLSRVTNSGGIKAQSWSGVSVPTLTFGSGRETGGFTGEGVTHGGGSPDGVF